MNLKDRKQFIDEQHEIDEQRRDKRSRSKSKEPVSKPRTSRKQKKQLNASCSTDYGGSSTSAHQCVSSSNQMSTIHEQSSSSSKSTIPEEAVSFINLLNKFQDFGKNGSHFTTSESSTNKVHSKHVGKSKKTNH